MRFGSNVIMFEAFSVPMVGNAATSYLIGLTPEGAEVCRRMLAEDVPEEEVAAVDAHLPEHLQRGGFLESREWSCSLQSAYLHVTQACNLDCVGCYSCDEQRNRSEDLPLEALCAIVDELGRRGVSRLVISGGEPFLRDDLAALVRHAKEQAGIGSIDVLTNGTCISAEKLAALAPYVDRVSVSFDGASADAPSPIRGEQRFDQLVAAVQGQKSALSVMEERIEAISSIAERNLQNAGETEQSSALLAREAEALQAQVQKFVLKEEGDR